MNRMHLIAAAVAAMTAAGAAHALTPAEIATARSAGTLKHVRVTGASALRLSVAAYAKEICDATTMHVYFQGSNAQGTGYRAYACNLGQAVGNYAAGTPLLLTKRDTGGSTQGITPIARQDATQTHILVDATCVVEAGNPGPVGNAGDPAVANYVCPSTEQAKGDAGLSDVEPALLQATVNLPTGQTALTAAELGTLDVGPVVQALFGVVVNTKAYRALQEAQGIIAPGGAMIDVPADQSTWTAATLATIPSLPATFVRAAFTGGLLGGVPNSAPSNQRGWNIVIPTTVDANVVTKTLNICRRTEGSGTQTSSNAFFANNPCAPNAGTLYNPLGVAGSSGNETTTNATVTAAPIVVQEGTSAGQVENCVGADANAAADGDGVAYAIGYLGRESNPKRSGGDLGFRYVKLDGVAPQREIAKAGNYPIVYEATMQWNKSYVTPGSDKESFLKAIRSGFGSANALAVLDSDTQQGVMTPPTSYAGSYASQVGNTALFGSRVARISGNSCAALRVIK